jgi:TP901 family phage tail tape measure protein
MKAGGVEGLDEHINKLEVGASEASIAAKAYQQQYNKIREELVKQELEQTLKDMAKVAADMESKTMNFSDPAMVDAAVERLNKTLKRVQEDLAQKIVDNFAKIMTQGLNQAGLDTTLKLNKTALDSGMSIIPQGSPADLIKMVSGGVPQEVPTGPTKEMAKVMDVGNLTDARALLESMGTPLETMTIGFKSVDELLQKATADLGALMRAGEGGPHIAMAEQLEAAQRGFNACIQEGNSLRAIFVNLEQNLANINKELGTENISQERTTALAAEQREIEAAMVAYYERMALLATEAASQMHRMTDAAQQFKASVNPQPFVDKAQGEARISVENTIEELIQRKIRLEAEYDEMLERGFIIEQKQVKTLLELNDALGRMGQQQGKNNADILAKTPTEKMSKTNPAQNFTVDVLDFAMWQLEWGAAMLLVQDFFGAIHKGIATFKEYNLELTHVATITRATAAETDILGKAMLEASKISTYHYKELGESLIILGRAGFSAGESITMLPDIVHLATASMGTLREATEATVTTLEAFGLEPNKTTEVVDLLASTSITARLSMEQLSHEFSVLAPVAGAAGMSATDTATALGLMANAGLRSSVSAQALRVAISSLVNPSLKFKEQLSLVGVSAQEINPRFNDLGQILQTLREHGFSAENAFAGLDRRMVTGMVTLINNSHQWDAMRTKLSHGATAAEMAEQQMDSMSNSMTALGHSFQALAVTIGGGTNNTLVMLIHALQGIVDMLAKLSSGIPDVAKNFVLLTTVGGVALSTIKSLLTGIAAIASAKAISTVAAAAPAATGTSVAAGVVGSVASGAALGAAGRAAVGTAGRITAVEGTILGAEAVGVAGMATRGLTATDEAIAGSTPKIIALRERLSSLLAILFNPVVLQTAGLIAATYVIGSQAIKDVSGQTQLAHLEKLQSSVDNQLDSVVNITRGLNEHTTASARAVMQRQLDAGNFSVTLDKLDDWVDRFKDINNRLKDMMAEQLVNIDAGPWTQIKTYFAGLMNPEAQKESDTLGAAHLTSLLKSKHAYYQDDAAAREEAVKNTSFESNPNKGNIGLLARQQLDKDKENEDFSKLKIEEEREAFKDYMLRLKELGHKPSDRLKEQSINTETGLAQAKAYLATLHINPDDRFKWMGLGNIPEVPSMKAFDNIAFPNAPKWTGLQESTASLREKANIKSALGSPDIIKAMDAANEEEKKKQLAKTEAILAKLKVDTGTPGTMGHMLGVMQENVVKELEIWNKHSATIARLGSSTKPEDKLEVEIAKMGLEEVGPNMLLRAREYVFHALNKGISEGMGRLTQMFAGEAEFNPQGLKEVGSIALQSIGKYEEGAKKLQEELRKTAKFIDETPEIKSIAGAKALGVKFDDNGMLPKKGTEGAGILKTVEARIGFNPMLDVDPSRVKGLINSGYSEIQAQAQAAIELVGKKELFVQLGIYAVLRFKDLSDETHIEAAKFADKYFNEAQKALDTITQNKVLELKLKTHTEVFGASNATQLANLDAQAASVRALSETTIRASSSGTNSFIKLYTPNFSASEAAFKELTTEIRNSEIEYKSVVAEYKVQDDALVAQHVAKLAEISATLNKGGGNEEQVHRAMVAENASYYEKRKSQDSTYNTALEGSVKKQVDLYKKAIDDAAKLQQTGIDVYNQLQRMSQDISPHRLTKEDAEKQIMSRLSDANSAAYKGDADRVKLNIDAAEAIKSANSEVLKGDTDLADRIAASSQSIQDSMAIRKRAFLEAGKAAREVAIGTDNKTAGEVETGADNIRKGAVIKNAADLATSNSNAQDQVKTAQQRYADELAAMMTAPEAAAQALRIAHEGLTTGALEATTNLKSMSVATALFVEWLNKNLPKPEKPKVGIDKILDSSETGGTSTSGHVDVSGTVTLVGGDGKLATLTTEAMQKLADFVSDKMINGLPN